MCISPVLRKSQLQIITAVVKICKFPVFVDQSAEFVFEQLAHGNSPEDSHAGGASGATVC